ncbi:multiple epidermal growth factor-like domains protein 11 [Branchiostoma floridae]|uniref:Multiple epidermal growth factor-like domains protein 11 n=1 Tax=Branchiostoma floridae TaxID=7739 RepID=A0A9J7L9V5_BRAFL|nr:multiple epidermal growth factor-like domains protein 11 [Branchiostoma floridae]
MMFLPSSSYCQTPGLSWPTDECNPGWFCTGGAKSAQPATDAEGGRCSPGEFCPRGSSKATPCTPGMYCDNYGLAEPTGNCIAGYYCLLGARYPDPYDGDTGTGHICPRGYYCPEGSSYTIACPPGTFSNNYGNREVADCQACTMGSYCVGSENSAPSGPCAAGYYCPGGQSTPTPADFVCPRGHFCPLGSFAPVRCPPGSYQDQAGGSDCKECPAGFYCPPAAGSLPSGPVPCPVGYYCGIGTHRPHPCPRGTTSNTTYLTAAEGCSPCPSGCCCGTEGLAGPTGACGGSCVTVGNASEFSSASLIAVGSVAGVAILVAMATSLLYIGNRLELKKIQSAKRQPGMNGHYGSLREPHYEVIPDTVGNPPQLQVARIPPVEHTDIELQATGTDHQAKGVGGRNRRHPKLESSM